MLWSVLSIVVVLVATVTWRVWSAVHYSRQLREFRAQLAGEAESTATVNELLRQALPGLQPLSEPWKACYPKSTIDEELASARVMVSSGLRPPASRRFAAPATAATILMSRMEEYGARPGLLGMWIDFERDRGLMQLYSRPDNVWTSYLISGEVYSSLPSALMDPEQLLGEFGAGTMVVSPRRQSAGRPGVYLFSDSAIVSALEEESGLR